MSDPHAHRASGVSRRDALCAGLAMLGGGALASSLLGAATPEPHPPDNTEPDSPGGYLRLPEEDLLCRAEDALDRAEVAPWAPDARRLLLRLLCACLATNSIRNEIVASRSLCLMAECGWVSADVVTLVEGTPAATVVRATLDRLRHCGLIARGGAGGVDHGR